MIATASSGVAAKSNAAHPRRSPRGAFAMLAQPAASNRPEAQVGEDRSLWSESCSKPKITL